MAKEIERKEQTPKDVETQYCNSNDCRYDCTTGTTNKCNAVATGLL